MRTFFFDKKLNNTMETNQKNKIKIEYHYTIPLKHMHTKNIVLLNNKY